MIDGIRIEMQGLDEVVEALNKFGLDVKTSLELICQAAADVMLNSIEGNVGGSIGDNIVSETTQKSAAGVEISVGPSTVAWYARFVEYGTTAHATTAKNGEALKIYGDEISYRRSANPAGAPAAPFMRPAFDSSSGKAQAAMSNKMKAVAKL